MLGSFLQQRFESHWLEETNDPKKGFISYHRDSLEQGIVGHSVDHRTSNNQYHQRGHQIESLS